LIIGFLGSVSNVDLRYICKLVFLSYKLFSSGVSLIPYKFFRRCLPRYSIFIKLGESRDNFFS